jgi:hypothetical protein
MQRLNPQEFNVAGVPPGHHLEGITEQRRMDRDEYYFVDPTNPLPGSLCALLPSSQADRYNEIVARKTFSRYVVRAVLADNIPLAGDLHDLLSRPSDSLLYVNDEPLTLHLEYPGHMPLMYDLHAGDSRALRHIDFLVDTNHPVATLALARTAVNQLLDVLLRHVWLPLVIVRLDVYVKDEPTPLVHQLILPFVDGLVIGPLGGFGSFAPLAPYEALLREAVGAASPYYRFVCAFRLLEGVNYLRNEIRKLVDKFGVQEGMPRPPQIDASMVKGLGFDQAFADNINNTAALLKEFNEARNAVAHFLLARDVIQPLHISDGTIYRNYSCGGALLLFYAHRAVRDLMVYYNQFIYHHLARGKILVLPEDKEHYVVKFDAYTGKFGEAEEEEEEEEEDMSRPMFVQVVEGRKVEFINISHVLRVEIVNPGEGEPGSGTLYLQDGSTRTLGEDEVNWAMRVLQGLLGQRFLGRRTCRQDIGPVLRRKAKRRALRLKGQACPLRVTGYRFLDRVPQYDTPFTGGRLKTSSQLSCHQSQRDR